MIGQLSEGMKNSRMERAEAANQPPQIGVPQGGAAPPSSPPSGGAPAPQGPPPGPTGPKEFGDKPTSFVDYVVATLHDSETFESHVEMIRQGPQGAAEVAVSIGEAAVKEHQQRGIVPMEDEQAAALEIILEDVTSIGISEGSLPQDPEQAEFDVAQVALPMWAQVMGQDPTQLAQEMAQGATPEQQAKAEQLHRNSSLNQQGGQQMGQQPLNGQPTAV